MIKTKNLKTGYGLAFFLGVFGAHLFYYKKYIRATFYLLLSWTFVPIVLGWIDMLFIKKWNEEFNNNAFYETGTSLIKDNGKVDSKRFTTKIKKHLSSIANFKKSDDTQSKNILNLVKNAFIFYSDKDIISSKYEHIKTPKYILDSIREAQSTEKINRYKSGGISFEITMNQSSKEFFKQSIKYSKKRGQYAREIPFQTYWPTFSSLNDRQLKWYLYWREQVLKQNYIDVDLSYIFLFVYELINYSFNNKASFNISMLVQLLENYKDRYPKLHNYLEEWIADMLYEVDEHELANEWKTLEVSYPTLYKELKDRETSINHISISVWKKHLNNHRETKFFENNKNKIYKRFKQGMKILQEKAENNNNKLIDEWFQVQDKRIVKDLYRGAVIGRRCDPVHVNIKSCEPTAELSQIVTNLLRQAENVVRIESSVKREIKVDETVLPNQMKEEMLQMNNRFKVVSEKQEATQGSSIPQAPKQETEDSNIKFNWEEIGKKEKELEKLQVDINSTEKNENNDNPITFNKQTDNDAFPNNNNLTEKKDDTDSINSLDIIFIDEEEDYEEFIDSMTSTEKEFILLFREGKLSKEKAKAFVKKQGMMLGMFLTEINEKADEDLGDNLFNENEEVIIIIEEFNSIVNMVRSELVEN